MVDNNVECISEELTGFFRANNLCVDLVRDPFPGIRISITMSHCNRIWSVRFLHTHAKGETLIYSTTLDTSDIENKGEDVYKLTNLPDDIRECSNRMRTEIFNDKIHFATPCDEYMSRNE